MKKILLTLTVLFFLVAPCFGSGHQSSVSSVGTQTLDMLYTWIECVQWEANASGGVSDFTYTTIAEKLLDKVVFCPVSPAEPTANYDIYMVDSAVSGFEVLGGQGVNLSATATEERVPYRQNGIYGSVPIGESGVSISVFNNAVGNACGRIYFYYRYQCKSRRAS